MNDEKITLTVFVKGQPVSFESAFYSDADALRCLREKARGDFAADLVRQEQRRGLSEKQWAWVHKLATEALQAKPAAPAAPALDADLGEIIEMMDRAADAQKRAPRIVLERDGQRVVLARAGSRAKEPGTVNVTDGGPYGDNVWFGRVGRDGVMRPSRRMTDGVRALLRELAANPAKVAAQHGVATGCCCFCARDLSTAESRTAGYGPVCAERFGLPWGDTAAADAADAAAKQAFSD